ncbi:hypothetical protein MRB53_042328 [Persea americana]|nr:hypothetical protein MRB53_042328 [Persea americana]
MTVERVNSLLEHQLLFSTAMQRLPNMTSHLREPQLAFTSTRDGRSYRLSTLKKAFDLALLSISKACLWNDKVSSIVNHRHSISHNLQKHCMSHFQQCPPFWDVARVSDGVGYCKPIDEKRHDRSYPVLLAQREERGWLSIGISMPSTFGLSCVAEGHWAWRYELQGLVRWFIDAQVQFHSMLVAAAYQAFMNTSPRPCNVHGGLSNLHTLHRRLHLNAMVNIERLQAKKLWLVLFFRLLGALVVISGKAMETDTIEGCQRINFSHLTVMIPRFYKKEQIHSFRTQRLSRRSFFSECYYRLDDGSIDYIMFQGVSYYQQCPPLWEVARIQDGIGYCKPTLGRLSTSQRDSYASALRHEYKWITESLRTIRSQPGLALAEKQWALRYKLQVHGIPEQWPER